MSAAGWTTVGSGSSKKKSGGSRPAAKTAQAQKQRAQMRTAERQGKVDSARKITGGSQPKGGPGARARKIDEETADFRHAEIPTAFKVALMKARTDKKLTQAQLAQRLNIRQSVIADYESGRAIPDPALVSRMQRVLGVQLPKIVKPKKRRTPND
eukprot:GABV01003305.1.p1 GENE.GABV01003305.1~~GABV01003305.1.p1  ORF type:complete len:155 (+),score=56.74 GABV01003305.1:107-571(+)